MVEEFRIFVRGDIDIATSPQFYSRLAAALTEHDGGIVVDCSELTFIDASGIRVLIDIHRQLEADGRPFRVEHLAPRYQRIFDTLDVSEVLGLPAHTAR